jgi:hypothetical protein
MATVLQRETTEFLYVGITGDPPSVGAEAALLPPAQRPNPDGSDWFPAIVVPDATHPLWPDAVGTQLPGTYFVARLVGDFLSNELEITAGDFQWWIRLTDDVERPVRIAPLAVIVE